MALPCDDVMLPPECEKAAPVDALATLEASTTALAVAWSVPLPSATWDTGMAASQGPSTSAAWVPAVMAMGVLELDPNAPPS